LQALITEAAGINALVARAKGHKPKPPTNDTMLGNISAAPDNGTDNY
jgi:hypothetical protein